MFYLRRALVLMSLCCLTVLPVRAFTFSYARALQVKGMEQKNGKLLLPVANKKYYNVKVTGKALYDFLKNCSGDCSYPAEKIKFVSTDYRRAASRNDMIIAQVEFNEELILTFLIFTRANGLSVKAPKEVQFIDKDLQRRVEAYLTELVKNDTVQL